jgi:arylsulfatase A-like enzyme
VGRKILFVTTDQQRYDALGCNGGKIARTPVADGLAAAGIRYTRAHAQSVVCMPARATMLTGQYVRTHGVTMNGIPLPADAPSVAQHLREHGYRTALIGKAHFEPALDLERQFPDNWFASKGEFGPAHGFQHLELAMHGAQGPWHYPRWLAATRPDLAAGFYPNLTAELKVNHAGGGDTGACQVQVNPVPKELYHTDWVADRTIAWLQAMPDDADWFCWMSFPDPHHPWDPPADEVKRVPWREIDLPAGYPGSAEKARQLLEGKPRHWRDWFDGRVVSNYEAPAAFVPARMTPDQVREIDALTHVENELIDEALGRVLAYLDERDWNDHTDVIYTTDHGEFQGDHGLLFKGPYHVDSLMRLPLIWRPAPYRGESANVVGCPVGQVDLAPTFCRIAGVPVPEWMQGRPLPLAEDASREHIFTEWDSNVFDIDVHVRSLYRDSMLVTIYEQGTAHDGTEGELYDLKNDPLQRVNLWDDPARRSLRDDLVADLKDNLPPSREPPLQRVAMV